MSASYVGGLLGTELGFLSGSIDGPAYSTAAAHGFAAVASGMSDVCLTLRPVMQEGSSQQKRPLPTTIEGTDQFRVPFGALGGVHFAGAIKQRHMSRYGSTDEQFAAFAVAQREFASQNDDAVFRTPYTVEDYLASRFVSKPLHLLDCDYPVDSCSAIILTTEERSRDLRQKPVFIDSISLGTTPVADFYLLDDVNRSAPFVAAKKMWAKSSLTPADLDVAGLYDGFTVIALQWLEALGICGEGDGPAFAAAGETRLGGILPTNTDGGACNVGRRHGANFFIEVTRQLRGQCGNRQVPDAEVGVATNAVGIFAGAALLTV
ncbi:MAG: thiolase family protein [Rhodococcus fascians]